MFSHFSISHSNKENFCYGFGLIELLVSISILVVVVSIVLVQQTSFNGSVLLRSQAYEVALQLRDVQLQAVSAVGESGNFRSVLGVHVNATAGSNGSYVIFRDANDDGFYNAGEAFGIQGILDDRFFIRDVRATGYNGNGLSITFERPNFDARFVHSAGSLAVSTIEIDIARVGVSGSGPGVVRTVMVTSAGQISVQ